MLPRCVWCSALFLAASLAVANDWPQWQGPERNNYCKETGLLKTWPADGPPLAWRAKGMGGGYSTPSVAAGRIFGMGQRNHAEIVWALEEATGKEVWSAIVNNRPPNVGYGEGPRCTPTVDGDRLYALGVGGDLVCLGVADGKEVWRKNYERDFNGRMMSGWGFSESPLVDGNQLICTPGGDDAALVALDKMTGKLLWKSAIRNGGGAGYASVVVSEGGGVRQYVQLLGESGGLVGVRASDGKRLWQYHRMANGTANIPTPIVRDDYVFCSTGYGAGAALLKLVPANGGVKAEEVYFLSGDDFQNHHGGMVLVGDYLYAGNGHNAGEPTCLEFKTGRIAWRQDAPGSGSASILYAEGNLYFRWQDGTMALVGATPAGYQEHGKFHLPRMANAKPSWPHPVIANGKLYIRDQDALLCYDVKQP